MTLRIRSAIAVGAAALLSCNTNFAPQYLVQDLRILAVRAQVVGNADGLADADVGDTLALSALVANPQRLPGATVRWKACFPQQGQSVSPCLDPAVLRDPDALSGPGVVELGEGLSVRVAIPSELAPLLHALVERAQAEPELACTLYAELPVVAIASAPGAATRLALKTARLAPAHEVAGTPLARAYVRNLNPELDRVRAPSDPVFCAGGTTVARACANDGDCDGPGARCDRSSPGSAGAPGQCAYAMAPGGQALCALARNDPAQRYRQCQTTGQVTVFEDTAFQWYATGGVFKDSDGGGLGANGNVTSDRVTFTPPAGPFTLWVIVRDGRGGEDWLTRDYP